MFMNQQVLMCVVVAREREQGEIKRAGMTVPCTTLKAFLEVCSFSAVHRKNFGLVPL